MANDIIFICSIKIRSISLYPLINENKISIRQIEREPKRSNNKKNTDQKSSKVTAEVLIQSLTETLHERRSGYSFKFNGIREV